jgi:flagellar biosynthesis protein FlhA
MPPVPQPAVFSALHFGRGLIFPVLIAASVLVIVVPLPPFVLDLLLSANITVAVVILLTTIYVSKPLDFSVFPSLLLGTTLARLVLNVASTRLILTHGAQDRTAAAGGVIEAFGTFVAGDELAVGLIIFVIIVAIQFLVITKGATRISEVAARFALDGMPGKQMAIDADLNAGIINAADAKRRREEVGLQSDFYGAMDGASKFVRGDAIAGIVITLINIAGGIYVGMVNHGMQVMDAMQVFTKLTIGDGLVTQVPAFLISLAAGLLVTRSSAASELSQDIVGQMFLHPQALVVSAVFLGALSLTGLPAVPLLSLAGGLLYASRQVTKSQSKQAVVATQAKAEADKPAEKPQPKPEDNLVVDPMTVELGFGLIRLADKSSGGDLLERVTRVRHRIAQEMGMILPKVRIKDNIRLDQRQYQIRLQDIPIAQGAVFAEGLLAIDTGGVTGRLQGIETTEPAFGRPAVWIEAGAKERAEMLGYNVVEPTAVIVTHLTELVREYSHELLSRQQVHQLLDNLRGISPKVVDELIPETLKVSQLHQVLTNLLRERVPIRQLESILEVLGDYADRIKDLGLLTEYVRNGLARTICQQYRDATNTIYVVTFDPSVEDIVAAAVEYTERGMSVKLSPQIAESIARGVAEQCERLTAAGKPAVVLCGPQIRRAIRQVTQGTLPKLAVLSLNEITRDTQIEAVSTVGIEALNGERGRRGALAGAR